MDEPGYENYDYRQASFFELVRDTAAAVDVQEIIKDGYENEKISEELYRRRLNAVKYERESLYWAAHIN